MPTCNSDKIGLYTATIVGLNAMVGAGIFTIPSVLAHDVGPAGILSFTLVAIGCWFIALSLGRVAQLFPQEGSFYTYSRPWAGHIGGIIASIFYLLGIIVAMGLILQASGQYLHHYFPDISSSSLSLLSLAFLTVINIVGVSFSTMGQQVLLWATIFPILATIVLCSTKASITNLVPFCPQGPFSILQSTRIAAFSFFGFESAASLFSIIKEPEKNLPKALSSSMLIVAALYLTFITTLLLAIPINIFKHSDGTLTAPLSIILPQHGWLIEIIHFASIAALLGTLHSMIWSAGIFLLTLCKRLRLYSTQHLIAHGYFTEKTSIILIAGSIYISFITFTSTSFFYYTAIFIPVAYAMAISTLLTIPEEWKSYQNYITLLALATIALISSFALQGILFS
jgi:amino acid transporter